PVQYVAGVQNVLGNDVALGMTHFAISCPSGASSPYTKYFLWMGDGHTWLLLKDTILAMSVVKLYGFVFKIAFTGGAAYSQQQVLVDWVRYLPGWVPGLVE